MKDKITFKAGYRVSISTGMLESNHPERMSMLGFLRAGKGDKLTITDKNYLFAVATYGRNFDSKYIYTYDYHPEESWLTYLGDMKPEGYSQEVYEFSEDVYFRVNIKRKDEKDLSYEEAAYAKKILIWEHTENQTVVQETENSRKIFQQECETTIDKIREIKRNQEQTIAFCLLTDSHYTVNGTWSDTVSNIKSICDGEMLDGIIHLGDCTDGMVQQELTEKYVEYTLEGLRQCNPKLYYVIGNHDSNYFRNNPDAFDNEKIEELYFNKEPENTIRDKGRLYYYVDYADKGIRCIFLKSFDYREKIRYGFDEDELDWLEKLLTATEKSWQILIFSHVPPTPRLHYWSREIRGSERLLTILREYHKTGKLLGYIHGHNHADQIDYEEGFPIISIGCNKCEYFIDKKPEQSHTYERKMGEVNQELFDVLIISAKTGTLDFIRCGAGEDRHI